MWANERTETVRSDRARTAAIINVFMFWLYFPLASAPYQLDPTAVLSHVRKEYASGAYRLSAWWVAHSLPPRIES